MSVPVLIAFFLGGGDERGVGDDHEHLPLQEFNTLPPRGSLFGTILRQLTLIDSNIWR